MARSRFVCVLALSGVVVGACGQITGLSDDYQYDLGATTDGAAGTEGGQTDAVADRTSGGDVVTVDGRSDADSGMQCSDAQKNVALTSMAAMKNDACKTCLAMQCCMVVQSCTTEAAGCRMTLSCHLDCSEKGNPQQCFTNQCTNSTAATFQAVRSCATSFCNKECVL